MKRIFILLLILLWIPVLSLPLSAAHAESKTTTFIYDGSDLLSRGEEAVLTTKIHLFYDKYDMELFIYIPSPLQETDSLQKLGEQFWSTHASLPDGAVLVFCSQSKTWDIQGFGQLKEIYTKSTLKLLKKSCRSHFSNGNYYQGAESFLTVTEDAVKRAEEASDQAKTSYLWLWILLFLLILAPAAGFGVLLILKKQKVLPQSLGKIGLLQKVFPTDGTQSSEPSSQESENPQDEPCDPC